MKLYVATCSYFKLRGVNSNGCTMHGEYLGVAHSQDEAMRMCRTFLINFCLDNHIVWDRSSLFFGDDRMLYKALDVEVMCDVFETMVGGSM